MEIINASIGPANQATVNVLVKKTIFPVYAYIDPDGTIMLHLSSLLRAGGITSTGASYVRNFVESGVLAGEKRKFKRWGLPCYVANVTEAVAMIRRSRKIPNDFENVVHDIVAKITAAKAPSLKPAPAKPKPKAVQLRRAPSELTLADQAAGIAWMTSILDDTSLPYSLHDKALRARAELLAIRDTLKEIH